MARRAIALMALAMLATAPFMLAEGNSQPTPAQSAPPQERARLRTSACA